MKAIKYLSMAMLGIMGSGIFAASASEMTALNDNELAAEAGQALFNASYLSPTATGNSNVNTGFYKLGIEAQLDLNANIKKLQLGCGGVKGPGCDVDLDNVRFTGIVNPATPDAGPASDFTLINPFFEIAIKDPTNASTREITGFRVGADSVWGILSIGDPGPNPNDVNSHSGINSISGHLPTIITGGVVPTHICTFAANDPTGCGFGGEITSTNSTITVDTPNPGDNRFDLNLQRANRVQLNGIKVKSLLNLTINSDLDQSLKFIHNITAGADTNSNGKYDPGESVKNFGISVQSQDVKWNTNGQWLNAQKGWWMELPESKIQNFTTRDVYATLGAVFGLTLQDLNQNQVPVDNCYGGLTFC